MEFYTFVLKKSAGYWVALCLENGIVGQGETQEESVNKLKEAIDSVRDIYASNSDIYTSPLAIKELHEFLNLEDRETMTASYELRKIYA